VSNLCQSTNIGISDYTVLVHLASVHIIIIIIIIISTVIHTCSTVTWWRQSEFSKCNMKCTTKDDNTASARSKRSLILSVLLVDEDWDLIKTQLPTSTDSSVHATAGEGATQMRRWHSRCQHSVGNASDQGRRHRVGRELTGYCGVRPWRSPP